MCIRAIDYCPPVDIPFGDFLRGIVTADLDYSPGDEEGFRTVFIQSFKEWGIHPRGITTIGEDTLAWPSGDDLKQDLPPLGQTEQEVAVRKTYFEEDLLAAASKWNLESDRFDVWKMLAPLREGFWQWLHDGDHYGRDYARLFGLVIDSNEAPPTVYRTNYGDPSVEVHSVRPTLRRSL